MTITAKPILFSAPMIKALLREIKNPGTGKTQTRRIFKVRGPMGDSYPVTSPEESLIELTDNELRDHGTINYLSTGGLCGPYSCPYGKAGGLIYVRESYFQRGHWEPVNGEKTKGGKQKWEFAPESHEIQFSEPDEYRKARDAKDPFTVDWHQRLGRFMPRRYSRITLEVTDVRVERLMDISEEDAKAEGPDRGTTVGWSVALGSPCRMHESWASAFRHLWTSINGTESWEANPWIWAVSFKPHLINVDRFIEERAAA